MTRTHTHTSKQKKIFLNRPNSRVYVNGTHTYTCAVRANWIIYVTFIIQKFSLTKCFCCYFLSLLYIFCRNSHRSPHRKYRRHTNDLTGSVKPGNSTRHRLVATSSQLSIEVSELHALNGRLEISCLATIPAHVKSGEQYSDYKTYSVKSK